MESFEAHACAVEVIEDLNTFLIVLADQIESPGNYVELQRSLEIDEQDIALGMNTYCTVTSSGAAHYGGIASCIMTDTSLVLEFSKDAAARLGLTGYRIALAIPAADKTKLRKGLIRLFDRDTLAPKILRV